MKPFTLFLLFFNFGTHCFSQNFQLNLIGSNVSENKTIDSLNYNSKHKNLKSLSDEIANTSKKLSDIGFIENKILENTPINDSSYMAKFSLGERIKSIHIYIGKNAILTHLIIPEIKNDSLVLPYNQIESFLNKTLNKLEQKGYALAKIKLINIQQQKQTLFAELQFESDKERKLSEIVLKQTEDRKENSFPKGHLAQINRKYKNKSFNQKTVQQVHKDFEKFRFVNQIKYPEILFSKDTTKIYVYLEKRKSNTFDGFIGFSNNENKKIVFNGYLDVTLENSLKMGEQFSLYWKSDDKKQKTFKAGIELPYLFKSPLGLKAQINIFKQDSLFQNTKTAIDLGYYINYNTRVYLGYQSTESSDIQNTNNNSISDYKNAYITSNIEFNKFDYDNSIFPKKSSLSLSLGLGERKTNKQAETDGTRKQTYINLEAMYNFYLGQKNYINIKSQNYYLQSDSYIINELLRFGGINSIRGFTENSFQANFMSSILTEYRYVISSGLYIHTILDYGIFKDQSGVLETNKKESLLGLGMGLGVQTKSGLLKLAFANGTVKNQKIKFYNTILHICYNVNF